MGLAIKSDDTLEKVLDFLYSDSRIGLTATKALIDIWKKIDDDEEFDRKCRSITPAHRMIVHGLQESAICAFGRMCDKPNNSVRSLERLQRTLIEKPDMFAPEAICRRYSVEAGVMHHPNSFTELSGETIKLWVNQIESIRSFYSSRVKNLRDKIVAHSARELNEQTRLDIYEQSDLVGMHEAFETASRIRKTLFERSRNGIDLDICDQQIWDEFNQNHDNWGAAGAQYIRMVESVQLLPGTSLSDLRVTPSNP